MAGRGRHPLLFTLALTWIAVLAGCRRNPRTGRSLLVPDHLPAPFVSSAFVPTASMPGPVRAFAENQPVTSIVNTIRALFEQQPVGGGIWIALRVVRRIPPHRLCARHEAYRRKTG